MVAWTLLEEANCRITTAERGIEYRTTGGVAILYPWTAISGPAPKGQCNRVARFFLGNDAEDEDSREAGITNNFELKAEAGVPRPGGNIDVVKSGAEGEPGAYRAASATDKEEDEDDEPETLLLAVRQDGTAQIANPLVRFLHRQAHGTALPIYGELLDRSQLMAELARRLPQFSPDPAVKPHTQSQPQAETPAS